MSFSLGMLSNSRKSRLQIIHIGDLGVRFLQLNNCPSDHSILNIAAGFPCSLADVSNAVACAIWCSAIQFWYTLTD